MSLLAELPFPRILPTESPGAYLVAGVCLLSAIGAFTQWTRLLARSRPYRIDIRQGESIYSGRSLIWRKNVLSPHNYAPGMGGYFVKRLVTCSIVFLSSMFTLLGTLVFFIL